MAKKKIDLTPLTFTEIVLRGDAETIRQALEARSSIDTLLEEREAAYQKIAELERQVEDIVGEEGIFPFPAPPAAVAEYTRPAAPAAKPAGKKAAASSQDADAAEASSEAEQDEDEKDA